MQKRAKKVTKISTGENTESVTDRERDENNKTCENDGLFYLKRFVWFDRRRNNNQISRVCAKTYFLYDGAAQSIWGQVDPLYNGESQN